MKKLMFFLKSLVFNVYVLCFFVAIFFNGSVFATYNNNQNLEHNFNCNHISAEAFDTNVSYAKAKDNCYLFKSSDITNSAFNNVIFIVPKSYFVVVLLDINSLIVKVQYKNKIGYVSADSITKVDFTPIVPTLDNVTFDIPLNIGTQIRRNPDADDPSNILSLIPAGTKNVTYIASVYGSVPTGGTSNVWYYACYVPDTDPTGVYEGYVYSGKTQNLSTIILNEEDLPKDDGGSKTALGDGYSMNKVVQIVLIILICLPIFLVFVLLIFSSRKNKKIAREVTANRGIFDSELERETYQNYAYDYGYDEEKKLSRYGDKKSSNSSSKSRLKSSTSLRKNDDENMLYSFSKPRLKSSTSLRKNDDENMLYSFSKSRLKSGDKLPRYEDDGYSFTPAKTRLNSRQKSSGQSQKTSCGVSKNSGKKKRSISDLSGKSLTKKSQPFYTKFLSTSMPTQANEVVPKFPSYETFDDDDLL